MSEEAKAELKARLNDIRGALKRMDDGCAVLETMLCFDREWPEDAAIVLDNVDAELNDFCWENWTYIEDMVFDVIRYGM